MLLELGVGFNTPTIIRYPFEQIAQALPKSTLIRINVSDAKTPASLENAIGLEKAISRIMPFILS